MTQNNKFYMGGGTKLTPEEIENIKRLEAKMAAGPGVMDTKRMADFLKDRLNQDTMISIPVEWENMEVEPGERRFTVRVEKVDSESGLFKVSDFMMSETEGMKNFRFVQIDKAGKNCTVEPGDVVLVRLSAPLMLAVETPEAVIYQFMENQIELHLKKSLFPKK